MIDNFFAYRIDISNSCPLKCKYCKVSSDSGEIMSYEIFKKAMDFIESITNQKGLRVQLFGAGEPLVAFPILKKFFNNYNNPCNYSFELITNGVLLTKDIINFLEEHNIEIHLSLDGYKEIHDESRIFRKNNFPSYDLIINNLKELSKPLEGVVCTLTSKSVDKLIQIYDSLTKINTNSFFINFDKFDVYTEVQKEKYLQHIRNIIDKDYKLIEDVIIKKENKKPSFSNIFHSKNYSNPNFFKTFRNTGRELIIAQNGDLKFSLPQHTTIGSNDIRAMGFLVPFGNIITGEINQNFYLNLTKQYGLSFEGITFQNKNPKKCKLCYLQDLCQFNKTENFYDFDDNTCFYFHTMVFPYKYLKGEWR